MYLYVYTHTLEIELVDTKFVALATVSTIFCLQDGFLVVFWFLWIYMVFLKTTTIRKPISQATPKQLRRERPSYDARVPTGKSLPRLYRAHQAESVGCFFGACFTIFFGGVVYIREVLYRWLESN